MHSSLLYAIYFDLVSGGFKRWMLLPRKKNREGIASGHLYIISWPSSGHWMHRELRRHTADWQCICKTSSLCLQSACLTGRASPTPWRSSPPLSRCFLKRFPDVVDTCILWRRCVVIPMGTGRSICSPFLPTALFGLWLTHWSRLV